MPVQIVLGDLLKFLEQVQVGHYSLHRTSPLL
jgi:hypothetical protein